MAVVELAAPDVFVRSSARVGEGPVHDPRTDELLWVDIPVGMLHRTALSGSGRGTDRSSSFDTMVGAVVPRAGGGYAAAVAEGFATISDEGDLDLVYRELPESDRRMNDAKVDARGRMWAGSTTLAFDTGRGALHCWNGGHERSVVREDLTLPNGLGWSPDDRFFYLVDSMAHRLFVCVFDLDEGQLGHPRLLLQLAESDGLPDGLCVDTEGCLWLAFFGGGQVRRYAPDGRQLATLPLPVSKPTSCGFGPDGTLYVTSARNQLTPEELAAEPLAGSVFAFDPGVGGVPAPAFAG